MLKVLSILACSLLSAQVYGRDWYVSITRGKGKEATKEQPAKDMGNIASQIEAGDRIYVAEGTYLGKGEVGTDHFGVPLEIYCGYSDDFSKRDPWGAHKTILTGINPSQNYNARPRIFIEATQPKPGMPPLVIVDGCIIDHAGRNQYKAEDQHEIVRKAKVGSNPTPDMGALNIQVTNINDPWTVHVRNNIVINAAPTQGALAVFGLKNSKITIENNAVINNTGVGIYCGTKFRGTSGFPNFVVRNNTVLFTWKYDQMATGFSGSSIKWDRETESLIENNVLAFADRIGIDNALKAKVTLKNNLVTGNPPGMDYLEFGSVMKLDAIEDEAELLGKGTGGNEDKPITIPVSQAWGEVYAARVLLDREQVESKVTVGNTGANQLRSMLGLPLQGSTVHVNGGAVWLPRLVVEDAIKAGSTQYSGRGSSLPKL